MNRPHVFVSATGQNDNLGDSVLRRGYLTALRSNAEALHVLVGSNTSDYIAALLLQEDDFVYNSPAAFRRACLKSALHRRTIFAFNTGEMRLDDSYLKTFIGHLPLIVATKMRHGGAVHAGYGLRVGRKRWRRTIALILRMCKFVSWRDPVSMNMMHVGSVTPDWAVFEESQSPRRQEDVLDRDRIVVTVRGDREPPGSAWFAAVDELATRLDLPIHIHSQVRRDNEMSLLLAERFHAGNVSVWPENMDHRQWELETSKLYSTAVAVVSDRLHALLIGAREGALPIGLTPGSSEKVERTLSVLGLGDLTASVSDVDLTGEVIMRAISALSVGRDVNHALQLARSRLRREVREAIT